MRVFRNLLDGAHAFPFDIDKIIVTKLWDGLANMPVDKCLRSFVVG